MIQDEQGAVVLAPLRSFYVWHTYVLYLSIALFLMWGTPLLRASLADAAGQTLAIVNAGVESAEDAPFVAPDYVFNPGDFLYLTFEISGYKATGSDDNGAKNISLTYTAQPFDGNGVALADAVRGEIDQEVGQEDKNWLPKRRASFLLPSYLARGTGLVKVTVDDKNAKLATTKNLPFNISGAEIKPGGGLQVQSFRFERSAQDGPGLEIAAYRPGDTIWARFNMTGFKTGDGNSVHLTYGVTVFRPNGAMLFEQKPAAQENVAGEFYPPQFMPGVLSVTTTKDLNPGEYRLTIHVNDLVGKQTTDFEQGFRIE